MKYLRDILLCIQEIPVSGENILENTVCGVNKVSSEARRDSGKNCSGKMFARYLTMYSRNTSAWGKFLEKHRQIFRNIKNLKIRVGRGKFLEKNIDVCFEILKKIEIRAGRGQFLQKNMKKNGRKRKLFNSISKGRKHKFVQGANRARTATEIVTPIVYSDSLNLSRLPFPLLPNLPQLCLGYNSFQLQASCLVLYTD